MKTINYKNNSTSLYVLNYLKNFEYQNKKKAFLRVSKNILNEFFRKNFWSSENKESKLKIMHDDKNSFLLQIHITEKQEFLLLNTSAINYLLINIHKNNYKKIFNILIKNNKELINHASKENREKFQNKQKNEIYNYKSFENKFLRDNLKNLENRHLVKIFNKALIFSQKEKEEKFYLKQTNFERFFQSIVLNYPDLLFRDKELISILNSLLKTKLNSESSIFEIKETIADFILDVVDSGEKMKDFFQFKLKNNSLLNEEENVIQKNIAKSKIIINFKNLESFYYKKNIPQPKKNKENSFLWDMKEELKKILSKKDFSYYFEYIHTILNFYLETWTTEKPLRQIKYFGLNYEQTIKNHEFISKIMDKNSFENIFDNKFDNEKDQITISYDMKEYKFNFSSSNSEESIYGIKDIINSKLFWEFKNLLYKEEETIDKEKWNKINCYINKHSKFEYNLIKYVFDKENRLKGLEKKYKNFIFHRSISKFNYIEEYEEFFKKIEDKIGKKSLK